MSKCGNVLLCYMGTVSTGHCCADSQVEKHISSMMSHGLSLLLMFQGGIVLFQLIDVYGASNVSFLFIACCETIAIAWVYGKSRH